MKAEIPEHEVREERAGEYRAWMMGSPGGRNEEELAEYETDWDVLSKRAVGDPVMQALVACARVLEAFVDQYKSDLPSFATASAEVALDRLGRASQNE